MINDLLSMKERKYKALMLDFMLENRICASKDNCEYKATNYTNFHLIDYMKKKDKLFRVFDLDWEQLYFMRNIILQELKRLNKVN